MLVEPVGRLLLLLGCERWRRKSLKHVVKDEDLDIGLGLLLFPKPIQRAEMFLQCGQQVPARPLYPLPLRLAKVILFQEVKERELMLI